MITGNTDKKLKRKFNKFMKVVLMEKIPLEKVKGLTFQICG